MAKNYTTSTGGGTQWNWTGSRNKGRWKTKHARNVDVDPTRTASRKKATEGQLFESSLKEWKGNEWAQKALNEAWDTDIKGYRTMTMSQSPDTQVWVSTGGEGEGEYQTQKGGYMGLDTEGVSQFGHEIAARAVELESEYKRTKESEKIMGETKARGGLGSRGSTILTGGHKGVLDKAKTEKKSLIGA